MPESLSGQFISDFYTSLLHVSGFTIEDELLQTVYDGAGNDSGLALSGNRVAINNYIMPETNVLTFFLDAIYPVGCIFLTTEDTNPGTRLYGTQWERVSEGSFIAGVGSNSGKTFKVGQNSGRYNITISTGNLPNHYHYIANTVSDHSFVQGSLNPENGTVTRPAGLVPLTSDNTLQQGGGLFTSHYSYELAGNSGSANVGKTSGPIGASVGSSGGGSIDTTPPAYAVYVWKRIL